MLISRTYNSWDAIMRVSLRRHTIQFHSGSAAIRLYFLCFKDFQPSTMRQLLWVFLLLVFGCVAASELSKLKNICPTNEFDFEVILGEKEVSLSSRDVVHTSSLFPLTNRIRSLNMNAVSASKEP